MLEQRMPPSPRNPSDAWSLQNAGAEPRTGPAPAATAMIGAWQVGRPPAHLAGIIAHGDDLAVGAGIAQARFHRLPDGLVYFYATGLDPAHATRPQLILKGATPGVASNVPLRGTVTALVLNPHLLGRLSGLPATELGSRRIPADELWGRSWSEQVLERLLAAGDAAARWRVLHQALEEQLLRRSRPSRAETLVRTTLAEIRRNPAQTCIASLARNLGTTERSLQRAFDQASGISLKNHLTLHRFRRCLADLLRPGSKADLCALADVHGYADQAHLTRDFTRHCGLSPMRLLRGLHTGVLHLQQGLLIEPGG